MGKLITEMIARYAIARSKARKLNLNEQDYGNEVFIYPENEGVINPKYMSAFEYNQIVQFHEFLTNHEELSKSDVDEILNASDRFDFLLMLSNSIPNFVEELKKHGPKAIAIMYINDKVFSKRLGL